MSKYLFIFGRTVELSWHELKSVIPASDRLTDSVASASLNKSEIEKMVSTLGGVYKIAIELGNIDEVNAENLLKFLDITQNHVDYAISCTEEGIVPVNAIAKQMKKMMTASGVSSRFVLPKKKLQVSSTAVSKGKLCELIIIPYKNSFVIGKTVLVQEYEDWSKRDYGRPHSDAKSGMLPPKVARMLINITVGDNPYGKIIMDPFCGMGTILAEALMIGCGVFGGDMDVDAVEKSKQNIRWLVSQYKNIDFGYRRIFHSEAAHISDYISPLTIDHIITEPFMGSSKLGERKIDPKKIKNILKGLEKLYIGCFRNWHGLLKNDGRVAIAIPSINLENKVMY
ncbi:TRM11 family SAM-dependent methyltransferase, partial [Patescibacteria group bacterium]